MVVGHLCLLRLLLRLSSRRLVPLMRVQHQPSVREDGLLLTQTAQRLSLLSLPRNPTRSTVLSVPHRSKKVGLLSHPLSRCHHLPQ